jgi:membrane-associated protein
MELMYLLDSFHWSQLLQPQFYIENGGLWLLLFVVFAETGLFVGFFLPGDSLLFVSGIFAHEITTKSGEVKPGLGYQFLKHFGVDYPYSYWFDLFALIGLIALAGIWGNAVGYWTGRKVGPTMFS